MVRFDTSFLTEIINRDSATLIGIYDSLCQKSSITFRCRCGTEDTKRFHSFKHSAGAICRQCAVQRGKEKKKQTNLAKFGVEFPCQNKEYQEKQQATMLAKYGVTNPLQSEAIKQKIIATNLARYGTPSATQTAATKQKYKETLLKKYGVINVMDIQHVKDKIKNTNLEKYGVTNPMKSATLQQKLEATSLAKYGTRRPSQNATIRNKIIASQAVKTEEDIQLMLEKTKVTSLEKYGTESPNQADVVKQKRVQTSLERYGTENPMQNLDVQTQNQKKAFAHKDYIMSSGAVRRVQGYEHYALDLLLKDYAEEQIITTRKDIPRIAYTIGDKTRYYFPDIFIPHENKIIEVKSTWTYKCTTDNIHLKANATRAAGYTFELWVFNGKGNRLQIDELA
jgi:hypothetical protein